MKKNYNFFIDNLYSKDINISLKKKYEELYIDLFINIIKYQMK